jgi:hypothetical protein
LVDGELTTPPRPTMEFKTYAPYVVALPIDWSADPFANQSWRLNFQNLTWLDQFSDPAHLDLDTGAYVLVDWAEHLDDEPALEWTWSDAALGKRLDRVLVFIERYAAERRVLNRRVVRAAARVVASHLYAISTPACYVAHNNHGLMETSAVLRASPRVPKLRDGAEVRALARERSIENITRSVTSDGVLVENSPDYQVLYLRLLLDVLQAFAASAASESPAPPVLHEVRKRMQDVVPYLLQPNLTMPQFGDTENGEATSLLSHLLDRSRTRFGNDATLDHLEWVITRGAAGTVPPHVDRVFTVGGYAAFRDRWDASDPAAAITGHFKCTRLSRTHAHDDDTSFEIFGYGTELVVDTGKYSYATKDPFVIHQRDALAHNLLIIDGAPFDNIGTAQITASGIEPGLAWVQGTHTRYASR